FGISLGDYQGTATITHSGSWAGYRSFLLWIPDKRFGIAVLANTADADAYGPAMKVVDLYLEDSSTVKSTNSRSKSETKETKVLTNPDPYYSAAFLGTSRLGPATDPRMTGPDLLIPSSLSSSW